MHRVRAPRTRAAAATRAARVARPAPRSATCSEAPRAEMGTTPRPSPSATQVHPSPSATSAETVVGLETRLVRPHPGLQEPGLSAPSATSECTTPAARGEPLHLTGTDHRRAHRRGVPQRPAEHPGDDLEIGVRVVVVPRARRQQLVVVRDQAPEPDVARVVVRPERERVPRRPTLGLGAEPVLRRPVLDHPPMLAPEVPAQLKVVEQRASEWSTDQGRTTRAIAATTSGSRRSLRHSSPPGGLRRPTCRTGTSPSTVSSGPSSRASRACTLHRRPDAGEDRVVVRKWQVRDRGVQRGGRAGQLREAAAQRCG